MACELLDAPIGLFTLVDKGRQFFLAAHGLPEPLASARQTGLDLSVCQYAVAPGRPLIVCDARDDPVLVDADSLLIVGVLDLGRYPNGVDETAELIAADLSASGFRSRADPAVMAWKLPQRLASRDLGTATPATTPAK